MHFALNSFSFSLFFLSFFFEFKHNTKMCLANSVCRKTKVFVEKVCLFVYLNAIINLFGVFNVWLQLRLFFCHQIFQHYWLEIKTWWMRFFFLKFVCQKRFIVCWKLKYLSFIQFEFILFQFPSKRLKKIILIDTENQNS